MRCLAALACLLAAGCGGSNDTDDEVFDASPRSDAEPVSDAGPEADASNDEADAAAPPTDVIHQSGADSLRIAVAEKFQLRSACYPEPDVMAVIIILPVAEASAGQTVSFTPATGGSAHICPPEDSGENCENLDNGSVTFDSYDSEGGASGSYSLDGGAYTGTFNAARCE